MDINRETQQHAISLQLGDRMEKMIERKAFISIKDHKTNFPNNIQYRLINPARNNLGKVTQQIIRNAVSSVKEQTNLNLWMGTSEVLKWYEANKKQGAQFIQYDIEAYFPSISEPLLDKALDFANGFHKINEEQKKMIKTCRKSILFGSEGEAWTKNNTNFDVTMGSLDGVEISELIGLFMLNEVRNITGLNQRNSGLYRDDGLILLEKCRGPKRERIVKDLHKLFKSHGLQITIASTGQVADFLDVTLDLSDGSYRPYRKQNDTPVYINADSNHPPSILKHIPKMVEKRLQNISCNEDVFDKAKPLYEEALRRSGFKPTLTYDTGNSIPKKKRKRKITWFNPPFCQSIETNISRRFLSLVDKHFTPDHPLRKIFNRNTLKVSPRCMPNIDSTIKSHNNQLLRTDTEDKRSCNCRKNDTYPVEGQCLEEGIIYEATVKTSTDEKKYVGLTEGTFKRRLYGHRQSFRNSGLRNATELSKHIWELNDRGEEYKLSWNIIDRASSYNGTSKSCRLCLLEKYHILTRDDLLNKRSELVSKCRHRRAFLIGLVK